MVRTTLALFSAFMTTAAFAATTKLANTTVRSKASSTSSPVATVPAGTEIQVVGQTGGFTQVKFKSGGAWKTGYIASTQLNVGSSDATKALGTSVAEKTGYGDKDVAAAVMMNTDAEE